MTNVVRAADRFRKRTHVLLLLDLQRAHLRCVEGRPLAEVERIAHVCRQLLRAARVNGIRVGHARRVTAIGGHDVSPGAAWIEGCRPLADEMICDHVAPSCYSNPVFASVLEHLHEPQIYLAGFGLNDTGLATAIDGFSRRHTLFLVHDASGCHGAGARIGHQTVCDLIGQFSQIVDGDAALVRFGHQARHGRHASWKPAIST